MTLAEMSIEEVRSHVGSRVRSLATGVFGTIVHVSEEADREDYNIFVDWDNGNKSMAWHFWCTKVELLPEDTNENSD